MRRVIVIILLHWMLLFGATGLANAGPLEDGLAAFYRADYPTARRIWEALATQSDPDGQTWLGVLYSRGDGVPQDGSEAAKWFRLAANQGNPSGQYWLGESYLRGDGVPQDGAEAAKWFRLAADQGHASAQWLLGTMYDFGRVVPQNYATAVKWFRLAADQGDAAGQWSLGTMYEAGKGVPQNYVLAHMWYNLASVAAHSDTELGAKVSADNRDSRDRIASKMTSSQIAEAQKLAAEWKPK